MQSRILILGTAALLSAWFPLAVHAAELPGAAHTASAPVQLALTLDKAIELALSANPGLRVTAQNIAIADGARVQAGLWRNPELSVLREETQRNNRTQTVQISQPLELGGKRSARIAVADLDRTLAAGAAQIGTAELRASVTAAYFDALTAQERVELAHGSLDLAKKASAAANRRVIAGKISPVEETRSNVAAAGARLELVQATADLAQAKRHLAAMWGSTALLEQPLLQPDAGLRALPRLDELQAQLAASPHMQRSRQQILREEAQVTLERTQRMPDVAVTVGNKKDYELGRSQTVLGLSIPLPLFDRNQGNLLAALRKVDQARAQFDADKLQLNLALADAYQRAEVAQAQIETIRADMLPAAQSALNAAVVGFELGKFSFLDVLDAQRTLFQARALYLSALSDRYRSMSDIQRYVAIDDIGRASHTDRISK